MLHTINKSPFLFRSLENCLRFAKEGDPILLYEDGVYTAMAGTRIEPLMIDVIKKHPVYAIQADLKARAISKLIEGINVVDYFGFVDLVEQHKVVAWI